MLQADCTGPVPVALTQVPGEPLEQIAKGECLLIADASILTVSTGRLWLHGLYLRHNPTQRASSVTLLTTAAGSAELWMTDCILQGFRQYTDASGGAGLVANAPVYLQGTCP